MVSKTRKRNRRSQPTEESDSEVETRNTITNDPPEIAQSLPTSSIRSDLDDRFERLSENLNNDLQVGLTRNQDLLNANLMAGISEMRKYNRITNSSFFAQKALHRST